MFYLLKNGFVGVVLQRNTNKSKNKYCNDVFITLGFVVAGAAMVIAALALIKLQSIQQVIN